MNEQMEMETCCHQLHASLAHLPPKWKPDRFFFWLIQPIIQPSEFLWQCMYLLLRVNSAGFCFTKFLGYKFKIHMHSYMLIVLVTTEMKYYRLKKKKTCRKPPSSGFLFGIMLLVLQYVSTGHHIVDSKPRGFVDIKWSFYLTCHKVI